MDLGVIRWEGVEWMHLDQDRDRWRALVDIIRTMPEQENGVLFVCQCLGMFQCVSPGESNIWHA